MFKLFQNRLIIGATCLLLSGMLAFVFLPRLYSARSGTTDIVVLKQDAASGTAITGDMLTVREVGSYGLPENVVKDKAEITGLVAGEAVRAGEYLWKGSFASKADFQSTEAKESFSLSDGTYLLTIALPSESSGIAGILRAGDTVDVYGCTGDTGASVASEALTGVKVYKVLNSKLVSLDDLDAKLAADSGKDASDYDFAPAYVVFSVNEQQAKVLIGLEKDKTLHLTLRGTEAKP